MNAFLHCPHNVSQSRGYILKRCSVKLAQTSRHVGGQSIIQPGIIGLFPKMCFQSQCQIRFCIIIYINNVLITKCKECDYLLVVMFCVERAKKQKLMICY